VTRLGVVSIAVLLLLLPQHAAGQGRGRPKQSQPVSQVSTPSTPGSPGGGSPSTTSTSALRQFGSWVDDASVPAEGGVRAGVGVGYWRTTGGSQTDAPMLDVSYGVTDRVQLSASVPFYHANYSDWTGRGVDDIYVATKIAVIDPDVGDRRGGLAITPVLEILSVEDDSGGRLHWALPISAEVRSGAVRVYGSAGYFSRGAVFAGGAFEWSAAKTTTITLSLSESTSLQRDAAAGTASIPRAGRHRVDLAVGVAKTITSTMAGFVSVGRSLTSIEAGGTSLGLMAGLGWSFAPNRVTAQ
jgi:hypothetical protein